MSDVSSELCTRIGTEIVTNSRVALVCDWGTRIVCPLPSIRCATRLQCGARQSPIEPYGARAVAESASPWERGKRAILAPDGATETHSRGALVTLAHQFQDVSRLSNSAAHSGRDDYFVSCSTGSVPAAPGLHPWLEPIPKLVVEGCCIAQHARTSDIFPGTSQIPATRFPAHRRSEGYWDRF
jgi:hypothetical protein